MKTIYLKNDLALGFDAIFEMYVDSKHLSGEVLSKLMGVGYQGGIKIRGSINDKIHCV